jgi:hypothetical protein
MSLKRRYGCLYIPCELPDMLYFELSLYNKDLNNIVLQINKEFDLEFKIDKSIIDDNHGILLLNNTKSKNINITKRDINANLLFITHSANLDEYVKSNEILEDQTNLNQMFSLCIQFILIKFVL